MVGSVGSGKSSLISAILGEMNKTLGHVNVDVSTILLLKKAVMSVLVSYITHLFIYKLLENVCICV